jgi:hypothetical protein
MFSLLALAHFHAGAYADAIREAEKAVRLQDGRASLVIACSLVKLGQIEKARQVAAREGVSASVAQMSRLAPYANEADRQEIIESLRQAGLSDALT